MFFPMCSVLLHRLCVLDAQQLPELFVEILVVIGNRSLVLAQIFCHGLVLLRAASRQQQGVHCGAFKLLRIFRAFAAIKRFLHAEVHIVPQNQLVPQNAVPLQGAQVVAAAKAFRHVGGLIFRR